ncbi:YbaB/EbfC family nucleoid-associated protein [Buchnera aphidicola]|uniref:YbaB/EbfC family nucleoid-associated protein n=1 Tax=Buchnera aphidicola TaxID=9 RepID=UPI003463F3A1
MFNKNNMNHLMQEAKKIQEKISNIKKEIAHMTKIGEAGAGLVKVTMNGKYHCIKIEFDNSLLNNKDKEMIEDLTTAAFNDAHRRITEEKKNKMSSISPEVSLPDEITSMI